MVSVTNEFRTLDLPSGLMQAIESCDAPSLGQGPANDSISDWLAGDGWRDATSRAYDSVSAACCESGLWLLAGDLERSHSISQDIHTADGSCWHGIMHRREHDFSNAKYWFRKAGSHPVFELLVPPTNALSLSKTSGIIHDQRWDPFVMVDLCQQAVRNGGELQQQCLMLAWLEWQVLFAHNFRSAFAD